MTGPKFEHDCSNPNCCEFLGTVKSPDGQAVDVYRYGTMTGHTGSRHEKGVLIRWSDEGSHYHSFDTVAWLDSIVSNHGDKMPGYFPKALELVKSKESKP